MSSQTNTNSNANINTNTNVEPVVETLPEIEWTIEHEDILLSLIHI